MDPCYGDILIYLQTLKCPQTHSRDEPRCLHYNANNYLIINDTLYRRGVDSILHQCFMHEEVEPALNNVHSGVYGGHLSGLATTQNFFCGGFFWPPIFKDSMNVVKKFHAYQIFTNKMCAHSAPLFPFITVGPFKNRGIDFMTCNLVLTGWHHHIIIVVDYFMKWAKAMPTIHIDGETSACFVFNQIIYRFGVP